MARLSHVDRRNRPRMVNIGAKAVTRRVAIAEAVVVAPPAVMRSLQDGEIVGPKGPIFQTATIAGIQAAKRTADWIPMCHPIGLDDCRIDITTRRRNEIVIRCRCEVRHKTGVEMEALTGATAAALTVYDMCKALSHDLVIREIRLLEKTGGKSDFKR